MLSLRQFDRDKLGHHDDRLQQIVELVRDTAGERADGFHLERLAQLELGRTHGGDVVVDRDGACNRTIRISDRLAARHEAQTFADASQTPDELEIVHGLAAQSLRQRPLVS